MARKVSRLFLLASRTESSIALVVLAGSLYFPPNSALVSMVISLVEGKPVREAFQRCYECVFRYFLGGIVFAGLVRGAYAGSMAWIGALVLIPAVRLAHIYF